MHEGDEISTGPDSEVSITFADGSTILVQPMTQISMASLATQRNSVRVRMNIRLGKIAAKVNKGQTEASDYSVKTPTATTSVRGTQFSVQYDKQTQATTVAVEEGVVQITPANASLRAVSVSAGQQVQVAQNRVGDVTSVESAESTDPNVQKLRNILGPILNGGNSSSSASRLTVEQNTDRPGGDYKNFDLSQPRYESCRDACANDANCTAYTYVKPGVQGPNARCWLKSGPPAPAGSSECCISGVKRPQ